MIADSIVSDIRKLAPPGRFLKRDPKTRRWQSVDDSLAREKSLQALREKSKHYRAQLEGETARESKPEQGGFQQDTISGEGSTATANRDQLLSTRIQPQQFSHYRPPPPYSGYVHSAYYHGSHHPHQQFWPQSQFWAAPSHHQAYRNYSSTTVAAKKNTPDEMDSSTASHTAEHSPPHPHDPLNVQRDHDIPAFGSPLFAPPVLCYNPGLEPQLEQIEGKDVSAQLQTLPSASTTGAPTGQLHQDRNESGNQETRVASTGAPAGTRLAFMDGGYGSPSGRVGSKVAPLESPGSIDSFYHSTPPDTRARDRFAHHYNPLSPSFHYVPVQMHARTSPRSPKGTSPSRAMLRQLSTHWYHQPISSRTSPACATSPRPPSVGPSDCTSTVQQARGLSFPQQQMQLAITRDQQSPCRYQHGLAYSPLRRRGNSSRIEAQPDSASSPLHRAPDHENVARQNLGSNSFSSGLLHLFAVGHAAAETSPTGTPRQIPLPGATLSPRVQRATRDAVTGEGEARLSEPT